MIIDKSTLTYRKSTFAVVVDKNKKILLVQKKNYQDNEWQFPGGGVEDGETEEQTILRELKEELGTDKFVVLKKSRKDLQYDWPDVVIEKKLREKGKTYLGQKVVQFWVKFLGEPEEIIYQPEEIKKIIWVKPSESDKYFVFPNQLAETKKLFEEFDLI